MASKKKSHPKNDSNLLLERLESRVLLNAVPDVMLVDVPQDALVGETVTFDISFDLPPTATGPGYGPFVDLILPRDGADGASGTNLPADGIGTDPNGVTFEAFGSAVNPIFDEIVDSSGTIVHPLLRNPDGSDVVVSGLNPGDRFIVLASPLGSYQPENQPLVVSVTANVDAFADVGTALPIQVRGGFQFGCDPLDNPSVDDPNATVSNFVSESVTPQVILINKVVDAPEQETATGPNFEQTYTIELDIADGQTVTDVVINDPITDRIVYLNDVVQGGASPDQGTGIITDEPPINTGPLTGTNLTLEYASITGVGGTAPDITVSFKFYVPDVDSTGTPIIPDNGQSTTTHNSATADYTWDPLDPRDTTVTEQVEDAIDGGDQKLTNRSLAIQKSVIPVGDVDPTGPSPGDTIEYRLNFQVSDYFDFENIVVKDFLADGQTLDPNFDPLLEILGNQGNDYTPPTAFNSANVIEIPQGAPDFGLELQFNVSAELVSRGEPAPGSLSGNDGLTPGTTGTIIFRTVIDSQLDDPNLPPDQQQVVEGDIIRNNVRIEGTVLGTTDVVTDISNAQTVLPNGGVEKQVAAVEDQGVDPADIPTLGVGDKVTYRITYTLPLTRFQDLVISDSLPLPILDVDSLTSFNNSVLTTGTFPALGEIAYGPSAQAFFDLYGTPGENREPVLNIDKDSNTFSLDFGSFAANVPQETTIELLFTVDIQDSPFADGLFLSNLTETVQESNTGGTFRDADIAQIEVLAPELNVTKGVVSTIAPQPPATFTPDPVGPAGVSFINPGIDAASFSGVITSAGLLANPIDSDLSNVDAGDLVKFAIVIENTGRDDGFDLLITETKPPGFDVPASTAGLNLKVTDGSGNPLSFIAEDGLGDPDASFFTDGIRIEDPADLGGDPDDGAIDDIITGQSTGSNIVVITFDLIATDTVEAGSEQVDTAVLEEFGAVNNGEDWTDGVDGPFEDDATVTIKKPSVVKILTGTGVSSPTNDPLNEAVIGETVTYDIELTVPEGITNDVVITDQFGQLANMAFVSLDDTDTSAGVQIGAITTNVSNNGQTVEFRIGQVINDNRQNDIPDTITLSITGVVLNVSDNQSGDTQINVVDVDYTVSGQTQTVSAQSDPVTIIEPDVVVNKSVTVNNVPGGGGDAGDPVEYTIEIMHSGSSDTDAFELELSDPLPTEIINYQIAEVTDTANPPLGVGDFDIVNGVLQFAIGNNDETVLDFELGRVITVKVTGVISINVNVGQEIINTANIEWTSLEGDVRTPITNENLNSIERNGEDGPNGTPDYYADTSTDSFLIFDEALDKTITATSEDHTGVRRQIEQVAIGEIVRYRLVTQVPEATYPNTFLRDLLPGGLTYLNDGTTKVALVGDDPSKFTSTTLTGPDVFKVGNQQNIDTIVPDAVLDDSLISASINNPDNDNFRPGVDPYFNFGTIINGENDDNLEYIVVEFNAIVNNIQSNNAGQNRSNRYRFILDGRNGILSDFVTVRIVEPNLTVTKTVDQAPVDAGDETVYRIVIENADGINVTTAFDIELEDIFDINELDLVSVVVDDKPATTQFIDTSDTNQGNFVNIAFNQLQRNESITVLVTANVAPDAPADLTIPNTAEITYTSLPEDRGTAPNPTDSVLPSGTEGNPGEVSGERTGRGDAPNDYFGSSTVEVELAGPTVQKFVDPTEYTIGEEVSYEILVTLSEGVTLDFQFIDDLPVGLEYISHQIITDASSSNGRLTQDYNGDLTVNSVNNPSGSGDDLIITFGDTETFADNNDKNNAFVVLVDARVLNVDTNENGDTLTNSGQASYTDPDNNQNTLSTGEVDIEIIEPDLSIDKRISNINQVPPDAGDVIEYTVEIQHTGESTADAFEVEFFDSAPINTLFANPAVNGTGFGSTPLPTVQILNGGQDIRLTDGNGQGQFDMPLGATLTLTYDVVVQDSVGPGQILRNLATLDWSSLNGNIRPGAENGERDGSSRPDVDGLNDYFAEDRVIILTAQPDITKTIIDTSNPDTPDNDLAVGETVKFLLEIDLPEATYPNPFIVTDNLPLIPGRLELVSATFLEDQSDPDIVFASFQDEINDTNGDSIDDQAVFTFTDLVNPSISGSDPDVNENKLFFEIEAIVPDVATNVNGISLTNVGIVSYNRFDRRDTATVDIIEPKLIITKDSDTDAGSVGDTIDYSLVIEHDQTSTSPAYDIVIGDELFEGLGLDDKLDLVAGSVTTDRGTVTEGNQADDTTVEVTVDRLLLGETVTVRFKAILNDNIDPTGDTITNTATVDYDSNPGPGGRTGDDFDNNTVTTPQEEVSIEKRVIRTSEPTTGSDRFNPDVEDLAIGEVVTYQIELDLPPGTYTRPNGDNDPVVVTDQLPEFLALINGNADVMVTSIGSDVQIDSIMIATSNTNNDNYDDQLTVTLNVDEVNLPGDQATILIEVKAQVLNVDGNQQTGSPLTNIAEVTFDTFTDSATADVELVEPALDLTKVIASQSADPPNAGDTITYRITIAHTGDSQQDALNVEFADLVPPDTLITATDLQTTGFITPPVEEVFSGGSGIRLNGGSVGQFDMPLGATVTLEYTITLQNTVEHNQILTNDASLQWTSLTDVISPGSETGERDGSGDPDPDALNNYFDNEQVSETVEGFLEIEKSVLNGTDFAIGDTVEYQLRVNLFEGLTTDLTVTDNVPDIFDVDTGTVQIINVNNNIDFLDTEIITFDGDILEIELGDVINPGNNVGEDDFFLIRYDAVVVNDPANNNNDVKPNEATVTSSNTLTDNATQEVGIVEPFLQIDKTIDDEEPRLGQIVTYEFEITHTGESTTDAHDLIIQDTLPPEVTVDTGTIMINAPLGTMVTDNSSGNMISILVDELDLNESITISFQAKVTEDIADYGTTFKNTVTLDWDSQPGDNSQQRPDDTMDMQTATIFGPDLKIEKETDANNLLPGEIYDYGITVTNKTGPFAAEATNAVVVDQLPLGVTFVNSNSPFFQSFDSVNNQVTWLIPSLAVGQSVDLDLQVQLSDPAPPTEIIVNMAEVTHDDIDPTPPDNKDQVDTPLDPSVVPDLVVTKDDGITQAFPGDVLTYEIVVSNVGNQDASGVVVTDIFPDDVLIFVDASMGGVYDSTTGIVEWQLGTLGGNGGQVTLELTGQVKTTVVDPTITSFTNVVIVNDDGENGPDPTPENNIDTDTDNVLFYGTDAFNDFLDHPEPYDPPRYLPPPPVGETYLSGIADPGTSLFLEIRDNSGDLIGWRSVVSDASGGYFAMFQDVMYDEFPHRSSATQSFAGYNLGNNAGQNLRRYYEPASHAASFFQEALYPRSVFRDSPRNMLMSMQSVDERPLQFADFTDLTDYQTRVSSTLPAER